MNCFMCGQALEPAGRVVVSGYPGAVRPAAIRLHERCATHLAERVLASYHSSHATASPHPSPPSGRSRDLTPRETEILCRLAHGETNQQIARRIGVSERTVKNRVTDIFSKLAVASRTEAAVLAVREGLIQG